MESYFPSNNNENNPARDFLREKIIEDSQLPTVGMSFKEASQLLAEKNYDYQLSNLMDAYKGDKGASIRQNVLRAILLRLDVNDKVNHHITEVQDVTEMLKSGNEKKIESITSVNNVRALYIINKSGYKY